MKELVNSLELGKHDAESDAMSLSFLELVQLNKDIMKEIREKHDINHGDLYKRCKALLAKKQGKQFQIKIEKETTGQDLEGTYYVSIVRMPDNDIYERLSGIKKEQYLDAWYYRFMAILEETHYQVGFPGSGRPF